MRVWHLIVITYISFVAQSSLASAFEIGGVQPNFVVMGFLLLVPRVSGRAALLMAAVWGLLSDSLANSHAGIDVVCFALAAFVLWHLQRGALGQTTVGRILLLAPSAFVVLCVSRIAREVLSGAMSPLALMLKETAKIAGFTAACGALTLLLIAFRFRQSETTSLLPDVRNRWKMLTQ